MADITIQQLLEAGVHFGHQARRWNPKMKKFIFAERNGIYIIDLQKTLNLIKKACDTVRSTIGSGGSVLFVGTKPQASSIVKECAERTGQYYVNNRWAGGMLTNYRTIRQSVKRLDHIEKMATDGTFELLTKKEVQVLEKQRDRLLFMLEGIREMNRLPDMMIVVDTRKEKIAVNEASRLGIPICAILDTNSDPDPISYPIPGNDDAIRSIELILGRLTEAAEEGVRLRVDEKGLAEKEAAVEKAEEAEREKRRTGRPQRSRQERAQRGGDARPARKSDAQAAAKKPAGKSAQAQSTKEEKAPAKPSAESSEKAAEKTVEAARKPAEKTAAKPAETTTEKPAGKAAGAQTGSADEKTDTKQAKPEAETAEKASGANAGEAAKKSAEKEEAGKATSGEKTDKKAEKAAENVKQDTKE